MTDAAGAEGAVTAVTLSASHIWSQFPAVASDAVPLLTLLR